MGQNLEVHVLNGDGTLIGNTPTIDLRTIGENIQERWHKLYRANQIAGEIRLGLMFLKDAQQTSDSPTGHIDSEETTIGNLDGLERMIKQVKTKEFVGDPGPLENTPQQEDGLSSADYRCEYCERAFSKQYQLTLVSFQISQKIECNLPSIVSTNASIRSL